MFDILRKATIIIYSFSMALASYYPPWKLHYDHNVVLSSVYSPLFESQIQLSFFGKKLLVEGIDLPRLFIEYVFITGIFVGLYFLVITIEKFIVRKLN